MLLLAATAFADESKVSIQHYLQGVLFEQQGDYVQALKEYENVVILDPTATYVYKRQAELALELGDLEKALAAAQRALQLEGPDAKTFRLLGNVHWARGEVDNAKAAFKQALELEPHFQEALVSLANLTAANDPEEAKTYFQRVIEMDPDEAAEGHYQIALIEQRQGRLDAAGERLRQAVAADPDALQARYALAQLFEVKQDTASALAEYTEILAREPRNPSLWVRVGEIRNLLGDRAAAEASFTRAKELQKDHPGASFWLAVIAEERGEFVKAAALLQDSAHLASDPKLNLRLGYYLTQAGRIADAVKVLETAFKKWPRSAEVGYFLALGYDDIGQPAKAAAALEEVVRLEPASRDARFELAAMYEKTGRMDDSIREFRVLLSSHPEDAQALNYLGYSLADRGRDLPEALGLIERALAIDPASPAYRDSRGWALHKLGRSAEALADLKAAVAALPSDDTIWEHVGDVYQVLKDSDTAWMAWKRSLLLKPGNRTVADKIAALEADWDSGRLGDRLLAFLGESEGGVRTLFAGCTVNGKVAGKELSLSALVHFESSTVRVEMLGPLFLPVWSAYLGPDGAFLMDPLDVAGLKAEALEPVVAQVLRVLRDHWSGALFAGPGSYRKGWSRKWLETPTHLLFLSVNNQYLQSAESRSDGMRAGYKNFQNLRGHAIPKVYEITGAGYSVRIQLDQVGADFFETPVNLP